jgi:glycosyltransferase involved in cell wall biosynthesis
LHSFGFSSPARLVGARDGRGMAAGGVERYAAWLASGLGPAAPDAPTFAVSARVAADCVRLADGISAEWVRRCGRSPLRWRGHLRREAQVLRAARQIIAISPMVAAELESWHGLRASVLLNPVFAAPVPGPIRTDLLFVGHGFRRKGLDRFLRVLARLPGRQGAVVGRDGRAGRFLRLARRLGVGDRVTFVGADDATEWIGRARVLVHPARYEPYGNVVAEACAVGTPAVVSDATGSRCLLQSDQVWVQSEGVESLVERVQAAMSHGARPQSTPPTEAEHLVALRALLRP